MYAKKLSCFTCVNIPSFVLSLMIVHIFLYHSMNGFRLLFENTFAANKNWPPLHFPKILQRLKFKLAADALRLAAWICWVDNSEHTAQAVGSFKFLMLWFFIFYIFIFIYLNFIYMFYYILFNSMYFLFIWF